jgi:flagellar biosynthesis protein FlhA
LPAIWINPEDAVAAREAGYTVVDPVTVLFTHFSETVRRHARELLTRVETEQLVQRVRTQQPNLYEELIPNVLSLNDIQKVLQGLLSEKVSVRNVALILEILVDAGKRTKDIDDLIEVVRKGLGRSICENLVSMDGDLKVMTFDPAIEHVLQLGLRSNDSQVTLMVDPRTSEQLILELGKQSEKMMLESLQPVLLCSGTLRRHVKQLLDRVLPHISVLALSEVPPSIGIASWGIVRIKRSIMDQDRVSEVRQMPDATELVNAPKPQGAV